MLEGKELQLPNMSASDPLMSRIESLRMFLEDQLGDDLFFECYRCLNSITAVNDQAMDQLTNKLTEEQRRFLPLITQLLVCEDAINKQSMVNM
ncbi:hypothetical protein ADEAN_000862800 [Angomonas deanei]|uniref:Uncharacterized protein n=1 Tax=Angomonas deanei TaxID=59799 RepID=A0A7G2CPR9_9TRYP|nr:hypothetical protein ADEAN_000862800 [Angomonas deanei]